MAKSPSFWSHFTCQVLHTVYDSVCFLVPLSKFCNLKYELLYHTWILFINFSVDTCMYSTKVLLHVKVISTSIYWACFVILYQGKKYWIVLSVWLYLVKKRPSAWVPVHFISLLFWNKEWNLVCSSLYPRYSWRVLNHLVWFFNQMKIDLKIRLCTHILVFLNKQD